jgi:hypothetical protein
MDNWEFVEELCTDNNKFTYDRRTLESIKKARFEAIYEFRTKQNIYFPNQDLTLKKELLINEEIAFAKKKIIEYQQKWEGEKGIINKQDLGYAMKAHHQYISFLEEISPKSKEDEKLKGLNELANYLIGKKCIEITERDKFLTLFTKNTVPKPIKWGTIEKRIIELVEQMVANNLYEYVEGLDSCAFIEKNFIKKNGENFKRKQLQIVRASKDNKDDDLIKGYFSKKSNKKVNF